MPPGRNSLLVSGNWENRSLLSAVCSLKVVSTTKPRSASFVAGRSALPRLVEPHLSSAFSHVARVPGVPTETPLVTSAGLSVVCG